MNYFEVIIKYYEYLKGIIDPIFGILIGAYLTSKITFKQVKNNNRFIILKEIKQELILTMDGVHEKINIITMKTNDFYQYLNIKDYKNIRVSLDEILLLYNEILQFKNILISNFELLNTIFGNYIGKSELNNTIYQVKEYLDYYYDRIYIRMKNPAFQQESFVTDEEYYNAFENFQMVYQHDDYTIKYHGLADCHMGKVVEFINYKLAKLVK